MDLVKTALVVRRYLDLKVLGLERFKAKLFQKQRKQTLHFR